MGGHRAPDAGRLCVPRAVARACLRAGAGRGRTAVERASARHNRIDDARGHRHPQAPRLWHRDLPAQPAAAARAHRPGYGVRPAAAARRAGARGAAGAQLPPRHGVGEALLRRRAALDSVQTRAPVARPLPRAALRAAAAGPVPRRRHHPRLHPPDIPAVPAAPPRPRLRPHHVLDGGAPRQPHPDRFGSLEERHPALLRRAGLESHGHLRRGRRPVLRGARG